MAKRNKSKHVSIAIKDGIDQCIDKAQGRLDMAFELLQVEFSGRQGQHLKTMLNRAKRRIEDFYAKFNEYQCKLKGK